MNELIGYLKTSAIEEIVRKKTEYSPKIIKGIARKGLKCQGLSLEEAAVLLKVNDSDLLQIIFEAAGQVKDKIYGNRIVLFAPLYLSNACSNNCKYCGFRVGNKHMERKTLTPEEAAEEAALLEQKGHKRLLLVAGEDSKTVTIEYLQECIRQIYDKTDIRRVNINVAPMTVEEFKAIKSAGIGTYQVFQETYHLPTYKEMHPTGPKVDYEWRVTALDRALTAGIDDIGIGALYGLYDYRFETLAVINHAFYLEKRFGVGPHTVSVPRLKHASGAILTEPHLQVSDLELKKIVAVLRLTLPYTGLILSTRETADLRDDLLNLGISQMSAGSSTSPGGYGKGSEDKSQFGLSDHRTLEEVVRDICNSGFIPSFCTACYRNSRTGEDFMAFAKTGDIHRFCHPNALLTLAEYMRDYATADIKHLGQAIIDKEINSLEDHKLEQITREYLGKIRAGEADLFV